MDLLAYLQESTDDDDDEGGGNNALSGSDTSESTRNKRVCNSTETACVQMHKRLKVRKRGSIDVISSGEVQASDVFSRSTPHRRGHWAGHVKIPVLTISSLKITDDCDIALRKRKANDVKTFRDLLERRGISGTLVEHDDLHVSVSKHFSLQVAQIETFVRQLATLLKQEYRTSLYVESYVQSSMSAPGIIDDAVLLNDEKTRSFLCWKVRPNATLRRIVAHVDNLMKSYNQPVYYEPAKFHISIASFPGNIAESLAAYSSEANATIPCSETDNRADQVAFLMYNNRNGIESSITTRTKKDTGCSCKDIEEEDDSLSSSPDDCFIVPVHKIQCTMGTTKEYDLPLRSNK